MPLCARNRCAATRPALPAGKAEKSTEAELDAHEEEFHVLADNGAGGEPGASPPEEARSAIERQGGPDRG